MLSMTAADQLNEFLAQDCPHLGQWSENPQRYWGHYSATLQLKDAFTLKQFRDPANNLSPGYDWGPSRREILRPKLKRRLVYRQRPVSRRAA